MESKFIVFSTVAAAAPGLLEIAKKRNPKNNFLLFIAEK